MEVTAYIRLTESQAIALQADLNWRTGDIEITQFPNGSLNINSKGESMETTHINKDGSTE